MIKITKIKALAAWMMVGLLLASCGGKDKSTEDAVKNILAKSEPAIVVSILLSLFPPGGEGLSEGIAPA